MRRAPSLTLTATKRAVTAVLLSLATACAQTQSSDASGYRIFEMRSDLVRPVRPTGDQNIAWLDEERVLFEGWDRVLKDRLAPDREPGALHGLYIWNIRTGEVTRYSSDPLRSDMCFAEGYISYVVSRGGQQMRL